MRFLIDAQLPPALAAWLREEGLDAEHVRKAGMRDATDGELWIYALQHGLIVVTKDEDFAARALHTKNAPAIVWLRVGNTTNRALRPWLEKRLPEITSLLSQGNRLVEVI